MTPDEFRQRFGVEPKQDELERATCPRAGDVGHGFCGVCPHHDKPRTLCGCYLLPAESDNE